MTLLSRRTAIVRLLGAAAATSLGLHGLAPSGGASALAQEAPPVVEGSEAPIAPVAAPQGENGHYFYSLRGPGADGPLSTGRTRSKYGGEIGTSTFEDETFVMQHNYPGEGLFSQDWMGSRIGTFSIKDGALMVEALGEQNDTGCFALEMRHQAYRDRKYIRSYWLSVDPPTGTVALGADGEWSQLENLAKAVGFGTVRPLGEWNAFLFMARGTHFEGWVNGAKAVEAEDNQFGSGRISLIGMRMNRAPFRVRFRNLNVWDNVLPDPTTVWG